VPPPLIDRLTALAAELSRFARWLAPTTHDADDVVQETLIRALRAANPPTAERPLRAWLFQIARNVHVDQRRSQVARDRFVVLEGGRDELPEHAAPPTVTIRDIERADLEAALAQLPEGARTAVVLTDVWEFDHEEVAQILDIPVGTVKSRVVRARARLAQLLDGDAASKRTGRSSA